jgi:hypothetical protein
VALRGDGVEELQWRRKVRHVFFTFLKIKRAFLRALGAGSRELLLLLP